jgi:hypothetical protein
MGPRRAVHVFTMTSIRLFPDSMLALLGILVDVLNP